MTSSDAPHSSLLKNTETVSYPFAVFNIELTNECPMKCVMCPRTNHMTRDVGFMDFELFKKVTDELLEVNPKYAKNSEVWLHHFGESLTHPEFPKFVAYASSLEIFTCLSINPIMLNEKVSQALLKANPSKLYISLDGHDDISFEKIRGVKRAYTKSKTNLLRFLEIKKEMKNQTKIFLSMIDFELNDGSVAQMSDYWNSIEGIDEFLVKPFVNWNGDAEDVNKFKKEEDASLVAPSDTVTCGWPWDKMTVAWDGDVVPCCYDYDKKYVLGNVKNESLASIWNGEKMQALRREFLSNKVENPLCKSCDYLRAPYQKVNSFRNFEYTLGSSIDFSLRGNSTFNSRDGWSGKEDWGTWTDGESVEIALELDREPTAPLELQVACKAFITQQNPKLDVQILVDEQALGTWNFEGETSRLEFQKRSLMIPLSKIQNKKCLKIGLKLRNPRSALDMGIGNDRRKLGLGFQSLKVVERRTIPFAIKGWFERLMK